MIQVVLTVKSAQSPPIPPTGYLPACTGPKDLEWDYFLPPTDPGDPGPLKRTWLMGLDLSGKGSMKKEATNFT